MRITLGLVQNYSGKKFSFSTGVLKLESLEFRATGHHLTYKDNLLKDNSAEKWGETNSCWHHSPLGRIPLDVQLETPIYLSSFSSSSFSPSS